MSKTYIHMTRTMYMHHTYMYCLYVLRIIRISLNHSIKCIHMTTQLKWQGVVFNHFNRAELQLALQWNKNIDNHACTNGLIPRAWGLHDDIIKWKYFPRYWPFVWGIQRSPVNSPHNGRWRGAMMFSFICAWINGWVNNRGTGDLRRHRAHYDVIVM